VLLSQHYQFAAHRQKIAGSDQSGPQVCLTNREGSKMAMEGNDLAPDGKPLIDMPAVDNPKGGATGRDHLPHAKSRSPPDGLSQTV
jgi:hypothetical protein